MFKESPRGRNNNNNNIIITSCVVRNCLLAAASTITGGFLGEQCAVNYKKKTT